MRLPNSIDSVHKNNNVHNDKHKVFVIKNSSKKIATKNDIENIEENDIIEDIKEIPKKINNKEKKALQDLLEAWHFELTRTYENRPSPCYPINPITRRLVNPSELYDTLLRVFQINEEKIYHIDVPEIVNIFAYDRNNVFETYEDFINRHHNCREKLKNYFFSKQLRYEDNEWLNIPRIPLGYDFLSFSKKLAEEKYKQPLINSKDVLEQEKNIIVIPKLIKKTNKQELFRLLDRFPEELKYFTPLEAQFFGFTQEEGDELIKVYGSKDKKIIKQFRDKILKREKKEDEKKEDEKKQIGGKIKTNSSLYLLPFL